MELFGKLKQMWFGAVLAGLLLSGAGAQITTARTATRTTARTKAATPRTSPASASKRTNPPQGSAPASRRSSAASRRNAAAHSTHRHTRSAGQAREPRTFTIGRETAPPSAPAPGPTAAQLAADQRLLQQQEGQSARAAQINTQQVQQVDAQRRQAQQEVRIQDAPGPAQTGVVPAGPGNPVAPVNADDRIQDAPGPAQTLPQLPATAPTSLPQQQQATPQSTVPTAATPNQAPPQI